MLLDGYQEFCGRRIMSIHKTGLGRGVLAGASLLAFSCLHAVAQTPAAQSGAEQKARVPARVMETVDDTNRLVLRGNVHPLARGEFDTGAVSDAQPVTRMLLLLQRSGEQEAALRQLMEEQQSRNSPNYHAWLTPEQVGKQFGPADADVQAVTDWLTSHGFQVSKVSKGRTVIEFSGTAGQVRNAFATEIHKYNVRGKEHFANVSDPQIPEALAPVVRGVVALHNFRPKSFVHNAGTFRRNAKTGEVKPAFTFSDVNGTFYAVGPADFAKIYSGAKHRRRGAEQYQSSGCGRFSQRFRIAGERAAGDSEWAGPRIGLWRRNRVRFGRGMGGRRGAAGADYFCDHGNVADGFRCWRRRFRGVHRG